MRGRGGVSVEEAAWGGGEMAHTGLVDDPLGQASGTATHDGQRQPHDAEDGGHEGQKGSEQARPHAQGVGRVTVERACKSTSYVNIKVATSSFNS